MSGGVRREGDPRVGAAGPDGALAAAGADEPTKSVYREIPEARLADHARSGATSRRWLCNPFGGIPGQPTNDDTLRMGRRLGRFTAMLLGLLY